MPRILLLDTDKKWAKRFKKADKLINRLAMKIRIRPLEVFDLRNDALGEGELLFAVLMIGGSDVINFLCQWSLFAIKESLDTTWSQW